MKRENDTSGGNDEWQLRAESLICATSPQALLSALAICDGHGIFTAETFLERGLRRDLVDLFHRVHMSSAEDCTQAIEGASGHQVEAVKGVYGLELLRVVAQAYDIPPAPFHGRGTQARWYREQLRQKLVPGSIK